MIPCWKCELIAGNVRELLPIDLQDFPHLSGVHHVAPTNPLNPKPASVVMVEVPHGKSVTADIIEPALAKHKPMWAFMAHWEAGSGRRRSWAA